MCDQLHRQCPPINSFSAPLDLKSSWPKTKLQNMGAGDPPSTILDNQILHDDETRCEEKFYRVDHIRMLTRDLFASVNLLVANFKYIKQSDIILTCWCKGAGITYGTCTCRLYTTNQHCNKVHREQSCCRKQTPFTVTTHVTANANILVFHAKKKTNFFINIKCPNQVVTNHRLF